MTHQKIYRNARRIYLCLLFFLSLLNMQAQGTWTCGYVNSASQSQGSPQPTNCIKFLDDHAPLSSSDRTLEVKVNFWVFAPTTNSLNSIWINSANPVTQSKAQKCLDDANSIYSSIPSVPHLTVAGVSTGFTNAKIKLVLKTFTVVNHDNAYNDVSDARSGTLGLQWHDPGAINIFLGTLPNNAENIGAQATPGTGTNNVII